MAQLLEGVGKAGKARDNAIGAAHILYGYTMKEIGDHLGVHYATVSRAVHRQEREDARLQDLTPDFPQAETGWIVNQYRSKDRIEDDFKLLKTPELIRWRPCRHWTDTKIRAFGFCCVMALVLLRVMELKAAKAGLRMSPLLIKEELADLKEITLVYDTNTADIHISKRSSVQQRLWDLFNLDSIQNALTGHNASTQHKTRPSLTNPRKD